MNWERTTTAVISYPRWLRGAGYLSAFSLFTLLAIGTLVTTFGVGMADTVWPTPPWYLLFHERAGDFGWYVEHAHRIAGYVVGFLVLALAAAHWQFSPSRRTRLLAWLGIVAVVVGTALGMVQVRQATSKSIHALANPGFGIALGGGMALAAAMVADLFSRAAGRWQRTWASLAFLGIVVQGLLGGLRVYLNELRGPELAITHGVFAQVVTAVVCLLAMTTSSRWNQWADLDHERVVRWISVLLVSLLLVQIIFGGLLRHIDATWGKRLHPMLALVALGLAGALVLRTTSAEGGSRLRAKARALFLMMLVQAVLGVEALLRVTDAASVYRGATAWDAAWRSIHVWMGYGVFAAAAMFAARAWKGKLL